MYAILMTCKESSKTLYCAGEDEFFNLRYSETVEYAKQWKTKRGAQNFANKAYSNAFDLTVVKVS